MDVPIDAPGNAGTLCTMGERAFLIGAILFGIVLPLGFIAMIITLIR